MSVTSAGLEPPESIISLVRGWAVDWLNSHDPAACEWILDPDYLLHIGALNLQGRDAYVSGTVGQLKLFPGLGLTVHDVISNDDWCALRFTEHGASTRHDGAVAAWTGIALHRWDGRRIVETYAQEDYLSRQQQLASGRCHSIEPPTPAPWDSLPAQADPTSEDMVRDWLGSGGLDGLGHHESSPALVLADNIPAAQAVTPLLSSDRVTVDALFSAGPRVAFHARVRGRAVAGDAEGKAVGQEATMGVAGLVDVVDGQVRTGHVVRDRLGLRKQLRTAR